VTLRLGAGVEDLDRLHAAVAQERDAVADALDLLELVAVEHDRRPPARASASRRRKSSTPAGSTPDAGSSRKSQRGFASRAWASPILCSMPRE
jgi:hypothetical protein